MCGTATETEQGFLPEMLDSTYVHIRIHAYMGDLLELVRQLGPALMGARAYVRQTYGHIPMRGDRDRDRDRDRERAAA